ncbi:hypothetical protein Tco_1190999 [Tanacetum coccineum]
MVPNTGSVVALVNNGASGSGSSALVDDNVRQLLGELVDAKFTRMQESINALTRHVAVNGGIGERNTKRNAGGGQQSPYTRMAKLEFTKFSGEDVKGWIFRCEQFFILDQVTEAEKGYANWETYKQVVLARFGTVTDDPMFELKNLKYETTAREYEDAFDDLLIRIKIREDHAISLFMGGLPVEIAMGVRILKPRKLDDAYCLTNLQETTLNAVKKKNRKQVRIDDDDDVVVGFLAWIQGSCEEGKAFGKRL